MSSIWKDLLFLHGHLVHKDDLIWGADTAPKPHEADVTPALRPVTPTRQPQDCGNPACA